jgi:hypothetical protein
LAITSSGESTEHHTYRIVSWARALFGINVVLLPMLLALNIPLCLMAMALVVWSTYSARIGPVLLILGILLGVVSVFIFAVNLMNTALAISNFSRYRKTYLRISATGLEYSVGSLWGLRCQWKDVESISTHRTLGFSNDLLDLQNAERLGKAWVWQLRSFLQRMVFKPARLSIPLSDFEGWPDGELAQDLRHYAPQLFEGNKTDDDGSASTPPVARVNP